MNVINLNLVLAGMWLILAALDGYRGDWGETVLEILLAFLTFTLWQAGKALDRYRKSNDELRLLYERKCADLAQLEKILNRPNEQ